MSEQPVVPEVDVDELHERLADGAALLDVREPYEFDEVRVPGCCLLYTSDAADDSLPVERVTLTIV